MAAVRSHIPLPLHDQPDRPSRARSPDAVLGRLRQAGCRTLMLGSGDELLRSGVPPSSLLVVDRGAVVAVATASTGRRAILEVLGPGDVLGEEAIQGNPDGSGWWNRSDPPGLTRKAGLCPEVRALGAAHVLVPSRLDLERALGGTEAVSAWLALSLARRLALLRLAVSQILSQPVAERVLSVLETLADRHGRPCATGVAIGVPLTQDDLASMVGATRESVNRAVRDLRARGMLGRRGRTYVWTAAASRPHHRNGQSPWRPGR